MYLYHSVIAKIRVKHTVNIRNGIVVQKGTCGMTSRRPAYPQELIYSKSSSGNSQFSTYQRRNPPIDPQSDADFFQNFNPRSRSLSRPNKPSDAAPLPPKKDVYVSLPRPPDTQAQSRAVTSDSVPRGSSLRSRAQPPKLPPPVESSAIVDSEGEKPTIHRSRSNPALKSPAQYKAPELPLPATLGRSTRNPATPPEDEVIPVPTRTVFPPRNRSAAAAALLNDQESKPRDPATLNYGSQLKSPAALLQSEASSSLLSQSPTFRNHLNIKPITPPTEISSSFPSASTAGLVSASSNATIPIRRPSGDNKRSSRYPMRKASGDSPDDPNSQLKLSSPNENMSPNYSDETPQYGSSVAAASAAITFGNQYFAARSARSDGSMTAFDLAADDMLMQVSVQECIVDAKRFPILQPEKYDLLKKELSDLNSEMSNLHNRLSIENRIREAAYALAKSPSTTKEQSRAAQEQLSQASRRVDLISTDLWKTSGKIMETERSVLKHLAAVLRTEALKKNEGLEEKKEVVTIKKQLASAETKCKEQDQMVSVLRATLSRVEEECSTAQREVVSLTEESATYNRRVKKLEKMIAESEEDLLEMKKNQTPADYIQTKLELKSSRAEIELFKLDLTQERDATANLRLQLEEDQNVLEEKDRTISNLLSEMEELQNRLDMEEQSNKPSADDSLLVKELKEKIIILEKDKVNGRVNSIMSNGTSVLREQMIEENEKRKSLYGTQLKEAVMERERLKSDLRDERDKIKDMERQIERLRESSVQSTRENDDVARIMSQLSTKERLIAELKIRLEESDVNTGDLRKAYVDLNGSGDSFSVLNLVTKIKNLVDEKKRVDQGLQDSVRQIEKIRRENTDKIERLTDSHDEIQTQLTRTNQHLESELNRTKTTLKDTEFRLETLKQQEKSLMDDLKSSKNDLDDKKKELVELRNQARDYQFMNVSQESSSKVMIDQLKRSHQAEVDLIRQSGELEIEAMNGEIEKLEAKIKSITNTSEDLRVKLGVVEQEYDDLKKERDQLNDRASKIESTLKSQIATLERRQNEKIESLNQEHIRKVNELKSQAKRELDFKELDFEATLKAKTQEIERRHQQTLETLKLQNDQQADKTQEELARVRQRVQKEVEASCNKKIDELDAEHAENLRQTRESLESENRRLKEAFRSTLAEELAKSSEERERVLEDLEKEFIGKLQNERESTKREIENLIENHNSDMAQLAANHESIQSEMGQRLARSEASLVQTRAQVFEDQERLKETIDELQLEVGNLKKKEVEQFNANTVKTRDYEKAINTLRFEMQAIQNQNAVEREEFLRKEREAVVADQRATQALAAKEAECLERLKELQTQLDEYEGIKSELDHIEADYGQRIAKREQELRNAEAAITEYKESLEAAQRHLEATKAQLTRAKTEADEIRATKPEPNRANEQNLVSELERMQMTVVEMKTQKVELLEELDDMHHREQLMQAEINNCRRELEKLNRGNMNWDSERTQLESNIASLKEEIKALQVRVQDKVLDRVGGGFFGGGDTANIQKLRGDFRKQMNDLREEYTAQVNKESQSRQLLEVELRKLKREKDSEAYNKVGQGTQTVLKWTEGANPTNLHSY
ncbi:hypothetical protein HK096_001161 [Nowakowskiella sp. JEL0078]|nr:hypothetical protein HK096_001161 [Nowakowskiella sp. JEL0078]